MNDETKVQPTVSRAICLRLRSAGRALKQTLGTGLDRTFRTQENEKRCPRPESPPPPYEEVAAPLRSIRDIPEAAKNIPRPVVLDPSRVDPVLAAAYRNQTESHLLRLPDAILTDIMKRLHHDDILRLRHTSRDFMRLFSQSAFADYHSKGPLDPKHPEDIGIWARPRFPHQEVQPLCTCCLNLRKSRKLYNDRDAIASIPFIYCSGCKLKHRAFYFSPQQRNESNDSERICKGREGRLLICQHISISWDSMIRLADHPQGPRMLECHHQQHRNTRCHRVKGNKSTSCVNDKPRFSARRDLGGYFSISFLVPTHFKFKTQMSSVLFRDTLAKQAAERLPSESFPWAQVTHGRGQNLAMLPFDPNLCSCLDWGLSKLPNNPSSRNPTTAREFQWKLCSNPSKPWRRKPPLDGPRTYEYTGANEYTPNHQDRCAAVSHERVSRCSKSGSLMAVNFDKCREDDNFLIFEQRVKARVVSPTDLWWLNAIDKSLGNPYRDDKEMHGIMWCPDKSCRLNKGGMAGKYRGGRSEVYHHN